MKRVFITGGAGFIGSHLLERLSHQNIHSTIYDNFSSTAITEKSLESIFQSSSANISIIHGDIRDDKELTKAMVDAKPDSSVHLAAMVSVPLSIEEPEKCQDINLNGTKYFIKASKEAGVKSLVYASTAAVYGNRIPPLYEDNVDDTNPIYLQSLLSPYAKTKLSGERMIRESGKRYQIYRFFNVYGERQSISGGYPAVVPRFMQGILDEDSVTIFGDGLQTRDFIYAGDIAKAIISGINSEISGVFNVGTGKIKTILDLIDTLRSVSHREFEVIFAPSRKGDITHSYCNVDRIRDNLGFVAKTGFFDGIKNTYEYYKQYGF